MANETLGHVECPSKHCNSQAEVLQAKRKGAHLYSRCPSCGLNQGTGKHLQNYLYHNATWVDGAPTPPDGVDPDNPIQTEPQPKKATEPTKPEKPPVTNKTRRKWGTFAALTILSVIAVVTGVKTA